MHANDSYTTRSNGRVREITFLDLHTNRFTSIIHIYGFGEVERIHTEIPIHSFVFDELYSLHRWKVDHSSMKWAEEDSKKSFDDDGN